MKNKVRIIGGDWRSRTIAVADNPDLRPTPDRIRETVFNWLGQDLSGKICLDLFAGSGALGFEASSRGAAQVVMVEIERAALQALRRNIQSLKATRIQLVAMDALAFLDSDRQQFDVIFLDPPYRKALLPRLLSLLSTHLAESGLVYVEDERPPEPGADWLAWRTGQAGGVYYQLLKPQEHG
ncbi:16S rRNA (guanine(966)-N(2))-methyltransferase RsmD [Nitrosovibrio sp. Nv17]|jgi:16S rRNA (guanine(966)-N(2))-methyltransferase RsmD|uniref:16S rRNA (guanine(966)-N(2))-methyltransferase RsmD n=1 Tax=Nitrosovibrio sp. Nv17 TaxID=1855339 RepID=UPI0009088DE1|nr:16S rRNA (guanine(966)-N(2))-methyltransferase RsmD [Nitrosovibrio sp. Nv17]SFW31374.1 16S rRNA (guanine(966)-N(2))-methyltransferase RsmD [Nitrosovibrio sp. Nv17]